MIWPIITTLDWALLPIYIGIMILIAMIFRSRYEHQDDRKYFIWGLLVKLFGALAFAIIYVYNYRGGDTINYWYSAKSLVNLASHDFDAFWNIMLGSMDIEHLSAFTRDTGYVYYRRDPQAFAVNRFMVPFVFLGAKHFLLSTITLAFCMYLIVFRFYRFLTRLYPESRKIAAISVLFVPSVVFWSSGILKDSLTFAFSLLSIVSIYNLLIKPNNWIRYLIYLIFSAFIIISIKPYIFYALLAASLVWLLASYTRRFQSRFIRVVVMPMFAVGFIILGFFAFSRLGETVGGEYSNFESMAERAYIIQDDLKRDYYGGNSFDIGTFEPTLSGMLSKSPQAVMAGLYRPFIWEAGSILMIFSGLENIVLMILTILILFRVGIFKLLRHLLNDPFMLFSIVFGVVMAFFIGLTTANFGALVRYRIPLLPMFIFVLLMFYFHQIKPRYKSDNS